MSEIRRAYPLTWPDGWKRIPPSQRKNSAFRSGNRRITVVEGVSRIIAELRMLKVKDDDLLISTNFALRIDGLPRGDQSNPSDPGVAVYWREKPGAAMRCMAIDRYVDVAGNLAAVAATLEAMRAIERHGGAEILDRAFAGFAALPANASTPWRDVLHLNGIEPTADNIERAYRVLAKQNHPDVGGDREAFERITQARRDALRELGF